jgi:hypothetical protein
MGSATPRSADQTLAELTDKVAAISLALRPLCHDSSALPREDRRIVRESCEILRSVSAALVELLRPPLGGDGHESAQGSSSKTVTQVAARPDDRGR